MRSVCFWGGGVYLGVTEGSKIVVMSSRQQIRQKLLNRVLDMGELHST